MEKILQVNNLSVSFHTYGGEVEAVRDVSFELFAGETLAIVGESGSGKSVTAQAILQLIATPPGQYKSGEILFAGEDLLQKSQSQMEYIRGKQIGMIFQDPLTSLNPTMRIGRQIAEGLFKHERLSGRAARKRTLELLRLVGIPNPKQRMKQYPHEFSGGMRQRVMIAIALSCNPKIVIADEPTTALDVTIQAQILDLLKKIQRETGTAIILITHDLGVVANSADRVLVMYGGKVAEKASVDTIFYRPEHPYTWGLLASMPRLHDVAEELQSIPGSPPDLKEPPGGCPFVARCPYAMKVCHTHMPAYTKLIGTHETACWLLDERAPAIERPSHIGLGGAVK